MAEFSKQFLDSSRNKLGIDSEYADFDFDDEFKGMNPLDIKRGVICEGFGITCIALDKYDTRQIWFIDGSEWQNYDDFIQK